MPAIVSKLASSLLIGFALTTAAAAEPTDKIPNLTSADFGWQSNVADWQEPPPGNGHGPIKPDPEHPYTSNAVGGRTGAQPTKRLGDYKDPVLKPWASAFMKATNDEALSGIAKIPFAAQARCFPGSVPGQLLFPFEPVYFIQLPNIVYMIWQRDHMVRRVFMTDKHSENLKPTWFGESIGRYEGGDTFVIDTIGLSTKDSYIDNFRTPHTDKLHVVETFRLDPDGGHLTALARVEDPDTFNAPLTMMQRWFKAKARFSETICAENNNDYFSQGLFPVPIAAKPDF
jgi:hypothetical protein